MPQRTTQLSHADDRLSRMLAIYARAVGKNVQA